MRPAINPETWHGMAGDPDLGRGVAQQPPRIPNVVPSWPAPLAARPIGRDHSPARTAWARMGRRPDRRRPPTARDGGWLGRGNSKQDYVLGVDPDALARVGVIEPRELHDRAPGGVENLALDIPDGALDSV